MTCFAQTSLVLSLLLGSIAPISAGTCSGNNCAEQGQADAILLQAAARIQKDSAHIVDVPEGHIDIDHAHIICHSQSCEEAQAKLTSIQGRMVLVTEKLNDCSTSRQQLSADLASAREAREEVEAAVAECHSTRAELQVALDECARNRAEKTAAVAECAVQRAALEAELKQCVDVDRPAAENALAECNEERAELQRQLESLEGGGGSSSGSRRRRKSSLMEMDAETKEHSDSNLEAEVNRIKSRIQELKLEEDLTLKELQELIEKIGIIARKLEIKDAEFDTIASSLMAHFSTEEDLLNQSTANDQSLVEATKSYLEKVSGPIQEIRDNLAKVKEDEGRSLTDLASFVVSQAEGTASLLSLKAEFNTARHEAAKANQAWQQSELSRLQSLLEEKIKNGKDDDHEECEELRAQVVTAEAGLADTDALLQECLTTKKELTTKMEQAEEATRLAQTALEACLSAKTKMSAQLQECNRKCAELSASLQECLDAKAALRIAIDECHQKRDAARTALEECLAKKKELTDTIKAMKQGKLLQQDAHGAVTQHSESMDELVRLLRELGARFLTLIAANSDGDEEINGTVQRIRQLLNMEEAMENAQTAAAAAADGINEDPVGQATEQVAAATQAMNAAIDTASAENDAVLSDLGSGN